MLDMLMAIWHQDFDALIQMQAVPLLISCLMLVLLLESAFVFLPLPGDSLVLLAGGLVGMGVLGPEVTLVYLPLAAGMGSLVAYLQGR
ncbi:MAG: DedA family protein, partial [Aeromonas sp.]